MMRASHNTLRATPSSVLVLARGIATVSDGSARPIVSHVLWTRPSCSPASAPKARSARPSRGRSPTRRIARPRRSHAGRSEARAARARPRRARRRAATRATSPTPPRSTRSPRDVRANHGDRLRALVHMAGGFAMSGPVAESALDVWQRQIAINLTTAYLTARAFLPLLRAGAGRDRVLRVGGGAAWRDAARTVGVRGGEDRRRRRSCARSPPKSGRTAFAPTPSRRRRFAPRRTSRAMGERRALRRARRGRRRRARFSAPTRRSADHRRACIPLVMTLAAKRRRAPANGSPRPVARGASALSPERHRRRSARSRTRPTTAAAGACSPARAIACPARSTRTSTSS